MRRSVAINLNNSQVYYIRQASSSSLLLFLFVVIIIIIIFIINYSYHDGDNCYNLTTMGRKEISGRLYIGEIDDVQCKFFRLSRS